MCTGTHSCSCSIVAANLFWYVLQYVYTKWEFILLCFNTYLNDQPENMTIGFNTPK